MFLWCFFPTPKDDVPAEENGSGGSDDSDSDEDSSDEDSDESSEDEDDDEDEDQEEEEKEDEPLSLEWPDTPRKQATYLVLLPIVFPLWLTVPDVRNQVRYKFISEISCGFSKCLNSSVFYRPQQKSRKFFVLTFLGSIMWIAIFSYLMVWWAHQVSDFGQNKAFSDHNSTCQKLHHKGVWQSQPKTVIHSVIVLPRDETLWKHVTHLCAGDPLMDSTLTFMRGEKTVLPL